MSLHVEFVQHTGYLEVVVTGEYSLEEAVSGFERVIDYCLQTDERKLLIDFIRMTGSASATQDSLYALRVEDSIKNIQSTTGSSIKIAYVGNKPLMDTYDPAIEIAKISGLPVSQFRGREEALAWLEVK